MGRRETLITVTVAGELLACVCLRYHLSFRGTSGGTVHGGNEQGRRNAVAADL